MKPHLFAVRYFATGFFIIIDHGVFYVLPILAQKCYQNPS